ncbi:MAG: FtsK/SpoIIIE domain-containing protein, partial [Actinomycetota bacterium]|nr:FtsK/SpoIIIE domain-containing protein [Actinomycetota bacterium]
MGAGVERGTMFVRKKRAGAARRGKAASRKRKPKGKGGLHLPAGLEQRHVDLIALFLVAFGVYLVFVLFFGWEGGKVGYGVETALTYLFGQVGARIFTVLLLVVGGMLLTGTSVSALARGLGRGLRSIFRGAYAGSDAAARTVAKTHADWRQHREARAEAATLAGPTDVMSSYPEDNEDFEPTVALAEEEESDFDAQIFDAEGETSEFAAADEPEAEEEPATEVELKNYDSEDAVAVVDEGDRAQAGLTPMGSKRGVTMSEEIDYRPPSTKLLERGKNDKGPDPRDHEAVGRKLVETLGHFGVEAKIVGIVSGPHVSRFELRLAPGTKVKKVTELANDIAYALASTDIRILAPIPGKQAVGVEVPNRSRKMVRLGDIYAGRPEKTSPLVAWLGKGIDGNPVWTDIAKMPHVLVAGTTGSGKSGCVNAILSSILMQASPNEVRLVLVDPKQV